jgi:hypothetical protein
MFLVLTRLPQIASAIKTGLGGTYETAQLHRHTRRCSWSRLDATDYPLFGPDYLPALAGSATCRDPAGFEVWLASFKREAAAQGIYPSAINALNGEQWNKADVCSQTIAFFGSKLAGSE